MLVDTTALVLKSYNLAEADRIVVFLTEDHGIVRGVAKGAKRLKSRFGSGLEPFSIVRLSYFQKEVLELVSIKQVELSESFFAAAAEPEFLQKFAYLADVLIALTPPQDPNETLYRMATACLRTSAETQQSLSPIGLYFELWLLRLGGYLPDWSKCDECRRAFLSNEPASLQMNFHLLCGECRRARTEWRISGPQREMFIAAQRLSPGEFAETYRENDEDLLVISQVLRRMISQVIGREVTGERSLAIGS